MFLHSWILSLDNSTVIFYLALSIIMYIKYGAKRLDLFLGSRYTVKRSFLNTRWRFLCFHHDFQRRKPIMLPNRIIRSFWLPISNRFLLSPFLRVRRPYRIVLLRFREKVANILLKLSVNFCYFFFLFQKAFPTCLVLSWQMLRWMLHCKTKTGAPVMSTGSVCVAVSTHDTVTPAVFVMLA